ncbi:MAG: T9SS type A sorting domain-containing protein, partial [Bacteroidetes bacterium]|nr:T9SS type A sorting domain-containing protein [Bacteroidota bacterium]
VNNYGFEVQRGVSSQSEGLLSEKSVASSWEKIGFVAGHGNSNSPKSYTFTDQPSGGTSFSYRLKQIDNDGKFKYYDAITVTLTPKQKAELMDNFPNPFNPSTAIKFYIPNNSDVSIKIYDVLGKEVTTLINRQAEAGYHIVYWNGKDSYGSNAASGVYIYRLTAGSFAETKKMTLLK